MKAVEITEPGKVRIIEKEAPAPMKGEALLRVLYGGICGADVASYTGNQPFTTYPRIPGHEFSAEIVSLPDSCLGAEDAVDSNHKEAFRIGEIVTCNPYFNCGSCYACKRGLVNACHDNQTMGVQRDGAFQEYITMPVSRLIHGKGLSGRELALIEPFSISAHALSRLSAGNSATQRRDCKTDDLSGKNLLIMGAGPIGLFALIKAKSMGARVLIADMLKSRLELAAYYGADKTVNVKITNLHEECAAFTRNNGFDACVEACGAPETFMNCIEEAAHGADIVLIGNGKRETTFVHSILLKKELNVFGSRNALTCDFEELIDLVESGKADISKMITGIYDIDDAPVAFEKLKDNDGSIAKLMLRIAEVAK